MKWPVKHSHVLQIVITIQSTQTSAFKKLLQ